MSCANSRAHKQEPVGLLTNLVALVLVQDQQHNRHGDDDSQQNACIGHRLPKLGSCVSCLFVKRGVHPASTSNKKTVVFITIWWSFFPDKH